MVDPLAIRVPSLASMSWKEKIGETDTNIKAIAVTGAALSLPPRKELDFLKGASLQPATWVKLPENTYVVVFTSVWRDKYDWDTKKTKLHYFTRWALYRVVAATLPSGPAEKGQEGIVVPATVQGRRLDFLGSVDHADDVYAFVKQLEDSGQLVGVAELLLFSLPEPPLPTVKSLFDKKPWEAPAPKSVPTKSAPVKKPEPIFKKSEQTFKGQVFVIANGVKGDFIKDRGGVLVNYVKNGWSSIDWVVVLDDFVAGDGGLKNTFLYKQATKYGIPVIRQNQIKQWAETGQKPGVWLNPVEPKSVKPVEDVPVEQDDPKPPPLAIGVIRIRDDEDPQTACEIRQECQDMLNLLLKDWTSEERMWLVGRLLDPTSQA